MNLQTATNLMYAAHEERWAPLQHDPNGRIEYPPVPERTFWDKLDSLTFKPVFGIVFTSRGKRWVNPGPNYKYFCPRCDAGKIHARVNSGVLCCISCGTELETLYL